MKDLNTYLNDHLAGSVGALELLDHLIEIRKDQAMSAFLTALRQDIDADQKILESLFHQLGEEESAMRKAGAWALEKFSRAKLQVGAEGNGLGLLQALEGLALGITGKRSLWRTLSTVSATVTALKGLDYARLEKRAEEQFARVEAKCLELAPSALSSK